jgi:5-methyltetrahydrofolate--homocysteine methyltransferase
MLEVVRKIKPLAKIPVIVKPNAGLPKLRDGKTVFEMPPEEFGTFVDDFVEAGVNMMGGCCGTSPAYIAQVASHVKGKTPKVWIENEAGISGLSSARGHVFLKPGTPVKVIGERINPTGKKKFQEALREGRFEEIKRFAVEQEASGADLLDVNVGMSGIDEAAVMMQAVAMLSTSSKLPLVIDSSNPEIIAKALRLYPGRALINSISLEKIKEPLLEVAAKYGAMFILLPLSDEEVPATAAGRIENTKKLLARAEKLGFTKDDIVVDCITMTVSSEQRAGLETLEFVRWCAKDLGVNTTMGLSNVSFGLPERKWVNGAFLAMCVYNGLSSAIANPNELVLMNLKYASDVLTLNDKGSMLYVSNVVKTDMTPGDGGNGKKERAESNSVFDCVVNGEKEIIVDRVKKMLDDGVDADEIINKHLIPGINKVGELYEAKKYFLPQLIAGAEAMKTAFASLETLIQKDGGAKEEKPKIILATVKGDIHDIGKNIVGIMLKNYGFDVMDMGKDIDSEAIVDKAMAENAALIGLSALMTTTMTRMKEVVEIAQSKGCKAKIIIGGAVITQDYADEIGADGYSKDGLDAVRVGKRLIGLE